MEAALPDRQPHPPAHLSMPERRRDGLPELLQRDVWLRFRVALNPPSAPPLCLLSQHSGGKPYQLYLTESLPISGKGT